MIEEKPSTQANEDGEVVYRRLPAVKDEGPGTGGGAPSGGSLKERRRARLRKLAPNLRPIVVGFALLLVLVFLLGYLSSRQLDDVSAGISDLQGRQAAKVNTLLELRAAVNKFDNEVRARARVGEPEGTLQPPFALRLRNARDELNDKMRRYDHLSLPQSQSVNDLSQRLASYLETTADLNLYKQQGFEQFRAVDDNLDAQLRDATGPEQAAISRQIEELQQVAKRKVRWLWVISLAIGLLVAAASIREVQRRFREVRRSMEETRREREFSTQMLEGMVSAVAAVDVHDRIRSANSAFFRLFPQAAIGSSVHDNFASAVAMKMLEAATASRVATASYRGRWTCSDDGPPDCANKTFDVYSSPLQIDGEPGQIITLVDVTEAAEAEAVVRKTESLTAMGQATAQVAHEIKNPLGSIRLGVSMLRDTATDPESQTTIDLVERGIHHLNKLVVDVTQFSRQKPLERKEVELRDLVEGSLELIAERLDENQTPVEKHLTTEPLRGHWDEDQLRQVFVNLLANAVDASPERTPITITTELVTNQRAGGQRGNGGRANRQSREARLIIADQGSGMDEETRARIFEPFFTTKKRGTGLGLAISKKIVEQHDGTISVESAPGRGTRFIINLPLED